SQRSGVSLYNRKTGQSTTLGPDMVGYNRNVRTMPINWSPVNADVLFYASNAVWKTVNRGHSWTRISPDLTRQYWQIPKSAGKYASTITAAPGGSITALSPSPRSVGVLWAGTDDGNIQVTLNGGAKWTDVTPAEIKPWTRIFNIEAGHFDTLTAYAAANTLRIDDQNPHLWRTHDAGKTWTDISRGLTPGSATNSIREDPRKKGLLFASTETQVWVSYNDGDSWQSLKLDMPAISVRDIQIKDDSTCKCSDLVAATHGRGFYILDNITLLRQAAEFATAQTAATPLLFKPAVAMRIRFATNDPTPWPPEVPAGENPSPGALIDYFLPANALGAVKIEVLDNAGKIVRTYSSDNQTVRGVDPATDPAKYNTLCQQTPSLADCGLPLYWPAPQLVIGTQAGLHRFNWDLRFDPINEDAGRGGGAVPHRTYTAVNAPWAPPGSYTVRLTVDGKSYSQPITVLLDPRVKMPALQLAQLSSLSREMYDRARQARAELLQARSLQSKLEKAQGADVAAFKLRVDSLAPTATLVGRGGRGGGGGGGRGGAAATTTPTLESTSNALLAAAMAMQNADVAPTAIQIAAVTAARAQAVATSARWTVIKTTGLAALNLKLKAAGQAPITPGE
ncbi:MAG: glycoside hydrolase, partial [Gemmatimonadota bacterium]|nr:glycoside hydrolase [Gemmatimonadota bacterium]